jgi:hypothetical protein
MMLCVCWLVPAAGTGRVRPRENLRITCSNQSQGEAPCRRVEVQHPNSAISNCPAVSQYADKTQQEETVKTLTEKLSQLMA